MPLGPAVTSGPRIFGAGPMEDNFTQSDCSVLIGATLVLCLMLTSSASLALGLYAWDSNLSRHLTLGCLGGTLVS